jgi:hypothetical protein
MKKILSIAILLIGSVAFSAKPYGDAGCGLGSVLMGSSGNQVIAATTNGTSYTNLFGISSGTSNCVAGGAVTMNKEVPLYIEANKDALAKEATRGNGETITGLSHLMGCQQESFGPALKKNYKNIFVDSQMAPATIEQNIQTMISSDKNACGV